MHPLRFYRCDYPHIDKIQRTAGYERTRDTPADSLAKSELEHEFSTSEPFHAGVSYELLRLALELLDVRVRRIVGSE